MKSGKVWGETRELLVNPVVEFHRIEVKKGGTCSKHLHQHKTNAFYVEKGQLLIRVWKKNYDLVDETILNPGDFLKVAPGEFHQFEALEETIGFELYYPQLIAEDIVRETVGHA